MGVIFDDGHTLNIRREDAGTTGQAEVVHHQNRIVWTKCNAPEVERNFERTIGVAAQFDIGPHERSHELLAKITRKPQSRGPDFIDHHSQRVSTAAEPHALGRPGELTLLHPGSEALPVKLRAVLPPGLRRRMTSDIQRRSPSTRRAASIRENRAVGKRLVFPSRRRLLTRSDVFRVGEPTKRAIFSISFAGSAISCS